MVLYFVFINQCFLICVLGTVDWIIVNSKLAKHMSLQDADALYTGHVEFT